MILVYTDSVTERLIFAFDFIFKERKVKYEFTNDMDRFIKFEGYKINYSNYEGFNTLQFPPSTILFEEEIRLEIEQDIEKFSWLNTEIISFNGIPDPFASVFYLISDYTNYLEKERDEHNRAISTNSISHKFNWLHKCIADEWANQIIAYLIKKGFNIELQQPTITLTPTFDIDNTFAYKLKDGVRGYLSRAKDLIKGNKKRSMERKYVLSGEKKDPFDTFDYIVGLKEKGVNPKVFYLVGDYTKNDRNINWKDARHQRHILQLSKKVEVNLHPSYKSNTEKPQLKEEKRRLESIVGYEVRASRQHFLKLHIPSSYYKLQKLGFTDDYSSGYADNYGFRLGTSKPIPFFDLKKNQITEFILHPFAYMDGTLNQYLKLTIKEAMLVVEELYSEVEKYGGEFISIWHNETLGDYGIWKGWREVHEHMLTIHINSVQYNS